MLEIAELDRCPQSLLSMVINVPNDDRRVLAARVDAARIGAPRPGSVSSGEVS